MDVTMDFLFFFLLGDERATVQSQQGQHNINGFIFPAIPFLFLTVETKNNITNDSCLNAQQDLL